MSEPAFTSVHESNTGNKSTVHVAAEGLSYSYMYSVRRLCLSYSYMYSVRRLCLSYSYMYSVRRLCLSYSYMYSVRRLCVAIVQVLAVIWLVCHVVDTPSFRYWL